MTDIAKMPRGMLQNEINMAMREASTMAMVESQKKKREAEIKAEQTKLIAIVEQSAAPQSVELKCTTQDLSDGSISLICSMAAVLIMKNLN